mmetsp:Transcript_39841/g.84916  ORF Transcript_39841/g.84916 Transcript_39841/m.84916 type:complete len:263 (-) Transcript_39841:311-1099(-)|eukprot:CAMPEP_0172525990 /NCGR_PEP_ID=MMETSP1067-20121228/1002_1 /TAXON_ID=265564 ORGANISM="Thalassiosira punctigera, Strain Tpunct2005C2" /NCGR_SAMPLE_ID=MMETSP1067 /ASSEMBLY_ACC=CAM_ASM_000444 /LENGTH=262 /DNA_ID=CAMNT_0013309397 /DNA_START=218 /DNA_END=1006 /DNA_ORIENTATION=+
MGGYDEESLSASSTASSGSEGSFSVTKKGKDATGSDGEPLRPIAGNTPMEMFAGGIAAASVASSAAAMILQPVNIVFAAGGLSCAIGPYAYWQQRRLTDVVALQETHKALTEQVERLGKQNERLHDTVNDLSDTVDRLEDVEQALDVITAQQGQSIEAFEEQVADNRDILSKMQSNLKANVLQNLLQVVIRSDRDENMTIEQHEIGELIDRIKGINGVEVNEPRFEEAITQSGGSLQCVMDIIRNLMDDNVTEGDEIFVIKE